jgi:hypothetical protein
MTIPYRVETAKTGRSTCIQCKAPIHSNALRLGSLDERSGTYGRWAHIFCCKVPSIIHAPLLDTSSNAFFNALMRPASSEIALDPAGDDPLKINRALRAMATTVLAGTDALSEDEIEQLACALVDKSRWAKPNNATKRKAGEMLSAVAVAGKPSEATAPAPERPTSILGKAFVLTGTFEGGGAGVGAGKEEITDLIKRYGGRVTSAVSSKTAYVIAGDNVGATKVMAAERLAVPIIDMLGFRLLMDGVANPPKVSMLDRAFSRGPYNNGKAPVLHAD